MSTPAMMNRKRRKILKRKTFLKVDNHEEKDEGTSLSKKSSSMPIDGRRGSALWSG